MASNLGGRAVALEGIRQEVGTITAINDAGSNVAQVTVSSTDFRIYNPTGETAVLLFTLGTTFTLTIPEGETIERIQLSLGFITVDTDSGDSSEEATIWDNIGGVGGEAFPDGGEIEVTQFQIQMGDA